MVSLCDVFLVFQLLWFSRHDTWFPNPSSVPRQVHVDSRVLRLMPPMAWGYPWKIIIIISVYGHSVSITLIVDLFHFCIISTPQDMLAFICSRCRAMRNYLQFTTTYASQVPIDTKVGRSNLNSRLAQRQMHFETTNYIC